MLRGVPDGWSLSGTPFPTYDSAINNLVQTVAQLASRIGREGSEVIILSFDQEFSAERPSINSVTKNIVTVISVNGSVVLKGRTFYAQEENGRYTAKVVQDDLANNLSDTTTFQQACSAIAIDIMGHGSEWVNELALIRDQTLAMLREMAQNPSTRGFTYGDRQYFTQEQRDGTYNVMSCPPGRRSEATVTFPYTFATDQKAREFLATEGVDSIINEESVDPFIMQIKQTAMESGVACSVYSTNDWLENVLPSYVEDDRRREELRKKTQETVAVVVLEEPAERAGELADKLNEEFGEERTSWVVSDGVVVVSRPTEQVMKEVVEQMMTEKNEYDLLDEDYDVFAARDNWYRRAATK